MYDSNRRSIQSAKANLIGGKFDRANARMIGSRFANTLKPEGDVYEAT